MSDETQSIISQASFEVDNGARYDFNDAKQYICFHYSCAKVRSHNFRWIGFSYSASLQFCIFLLSHKKLSDRIDYRIPQRKRTESQLGATFVTFEACHKVSEFMSLFQLSQDEVIFEARALAQGKSYLLAQSSIKR